jgi:hypothetical protein
MPVIRREDRITTGAVWRSKRKGENRTVTIEYLHASTPRTVTVRRGNGGRGRLISEATLLRDYEYVRHA